MSVTLPAPLTRFVGREVELAPAAALLAEARMLTLTGPGGAGKTRLAAQLASVVADQFPDGVWFADFSALADGKFVWDEVAGHSFDARRYGDLSEEPAKLLASFAKSRVVSGTRRMATPG